MPDSATAIAQLHRFGLGLRTGERGTLQSDPVGWAVSQLRMNTATSSLFAGLPPSHKTLVATIAAKKQKNIAAKRGDKDALKQAKAMRRSLRNIHMTDLRIRFEMALRTEAPVHEKLVHFWNNHFAVSSARGKIGTIAATLEREAVRPHMAGSFHDMLASAEKHPAMLMYLDNEQSIGPGSRIGKRRKRGLNENLAREILELHTLGVDGGYSQRDVTNFAKVLTGWNVGRGNRFGGTPGKFHFAEAAHEPGTQKILGKKFSDTGLAQGEAVLEMLAHHPATARHIATKLVRHFVADIPPPDAVDTVAKVFLDTGGDLPSVHTAVFTLPHIANHAFQKARSPEAYLIAVLRATGADTYDNKTLQILDSMGFRPYAPSGPDGFPDTAPEWLNGQSLLRRIEWAETYAGHTARHIDARAMMQDLYGSQLRDSTATTIRRAESNTQGLALAFASPEMVFC